MEFVQQQQKENKEGSITSPSSSSVHEVCGVGKVKDMVAIVDDPLMGRCLESKSAHHVGGLLFQDSTVIFASNDEDDDSIEQKCVSFLLKFQKPKTKPKDRVTKARVKAFVCALADDESGLVQSLDTARNFLQAMKVFLLQQGKTTQGKTQKPQSETETETESQSQQTFHLLQALGPVRLAECTALLAHLRSLPAHKNILPPASVLSDEMAGRILGVILNNQLQLELFQGSGIFPYACILQHDCRPNCSFSSSLDGSQCSLIAIRDINSGGYAVL